MTRLGYVLVTTLAAELFAGLFIAVAVLAPTPRFLWNASASAPIGLYRIASDSAPPVGTLVAIMPPAKTARWLSARGYLPEGLPLLKHVAAKTGQRVCRIGAIVSVDRHPVAIALGRDSRGRPLPVWRGCRILKPGELLLLNPAVPDSMDSRYLGPLPVSGLLGRAIPLLTREAPDAPLHWRSLGSVTASPPVDTKETGNASHDL
ncbi:conjugal transfer protein [Croceicoccus estronivorus]|uniref:S26 family signal peptidase n=1 Tax=Croceicoccus estronivorus TaxID=1172626 RepID=UPI00082FD09D|nr:S26 family signal peptidase [Croceicoccus estronivorus]OCC23805.1 conjugal transfer protein [Croceicoccus estronivorus]